MVKRKISRAVTRKWEYDYKRMKTDRRQFVRNYLCLKKIEILLKYCGVGGKETVNLELYI
jgi:hypothetical protein